MKIALIDASPKVSGSTSSLLLEDLKKYISRRSADKAALMTAGMHNTAVPEELLENLKTADVWIFSYPLYVDGIPGHLLSCLVQLEKLRWQKRIHIYGIVNCGFYEGIQAEYALKILQNWCAKAGFVWGGGIGVGGGEALAQMPAIENGHGPKAPVDKALQALAEKALRHDTLENRYVSVAFPRLLYQMAAQMGWRITIKANGGKTKDLGKRPD